MSVTLSSLEALASRFATSPGADRGACDAVELMRRRADRGATMGEGGASETSKRANADYGWAMMVLGALLSASSVISLIQHGFHFDLNWGFEHFVAFYRGIITPVLDVVLWPVNALLGQLNSWFDIDWDIPQWMEDLWTLSFVGAAIEVRSNLRSTETLDMPRWKAQRIAWRMRLYMAGAFLLMFVVLGLTGWGLFQLLTAFSSPKDPADTDDTEIKRTALRNAHYRTNVLMTGAAVIVFYITNAIAPQLGLG